jgi:hypothetical protein
MVGRRIKEYTVIGILRGNLAAEAGDMIVDGDIQL